MTFIATTCIIIDEPTEQDRRVKAAMLAQQRVRLVDLSSFRSTGNGIAVSLVAAALLSRALFAVVPLAPKLRALLASYPHHGAFSGLTAAWRLARAAVACRRDLACCSTLHANDLYCAVAAMLAAPASARLIYDSHEIQFHRNRKTGWLRILIEAGLERMVVARADELHVVSNAIARLMQELYRESLSVRVVYNDFYTHHEFPVPPFNSSPALVYVGRGLSGRMLEVLDRRLADLGTEFFIYPLGGTLPPHISGAHWNFGPKEYEQDLLKRIRSRRCLMWCCHENRCLSYTYSLPNKFFQALAIGMPVIASRGTYLAEIIETHGLGLIFEDGSTLEHLIENARGPLFEEWRGNVLRFREQVRNGSIKI